MSTPAMPLPLVDWPADALKLVRSLSSRPARAVFAGRCVREALAGEPVSDLEVLTDAPPGDVLSLLPHAISVGPARATLGGANSRIDIVSTPPGQSLEAALARRDLTVSAMAVDPFAKELIDPFEGRADLEARRIRPTRPESLGDPLCALRACRLVAREGFIPTPELVAAMAPAAGRIREVARARIRAELIPLILGEHVEAGLSLLRECGLEAELAPDLDATSARWVSLLPPDLPLRLTAWLKGGRTIRLLRRLRFNRAQVYHVEFLLRHHPVERQAATGPGRRRLARQPDKNTRDLFELRRGEIEAHGEGPAARQWLDETLQDIEAFRAAERTALERQPLALNGRGIMEHLDCRPGPQIGRALAFLEEAVARDPELNTPDALRAALDGWRDA